MPYTKMNKNYKMYIPNITHFQHTDYHTIKKKAMNMLSALRRNKEKDREMYNESNKDKLEFEKIKKLVNEENVRLRKKQRGKLNKK
jgi:ATP-dependent protease HslVU (ClpYQ) ATPase subunit